jgi:predicted peroxiredoxin
MKWSALTLVFGLSASALVGCTPPEGADGAPVQVAAPPTTILNITSSGEEDPHAVTMALQLAGHSLDAGRTTVLFFNVRGVTIPTVAFPETLSFGDRPIKELLTSLMERGAEVHVCPHCMAALEVSEADLLPGAQVTNREALFGHMGDHTVVFTY